MINRKGELISATFSSRPQIAAGKRAFSILPLMAPLSKHQLSRR